MARLKDAVAPANFAPEEWQSANPASIFQNRGGPAVTESADLDRILALPRRPPVVEGSATAEALIELAMQKYARPNDRCECQKRYPNPKRACIKRLLWIQGWMLHEINTMGGLLAAASVGIGKTVVNILSPLALRDCPLSLLLIPSSLVDQIMMDYELISEHFRVPGLVVHTGTRTRKWPPRLAPDGKPEVMLHVLPYTGLSSVKNSNWLDNLLPSAIICDEVDAIKDLTSARTMRVMRYFSEHGDVTRFCGWTGSLTDSSLKEFSHLSLLALRDRSPMPMSLETVEEWSRCLDAVPNPSPAGELMRLCSPGESVRSGFSRRLSETEGFIMVTGDQIITTSAGEVVDQDIREKTAPPIPDIVREALAKVRSSLRPDTLAHDAVEGTEDEILNDPMDKARCAREVATGMFYRWKFPPIRGVPQRIAKIKDWYRFRKFWNSVVREEMLKGRPNMDSAKLVENAARRAWGDLPPDPSLPVFPAAEWPAWRDIEHEVYYEQEAVRLHPYLVDDAAEWGLANRGIIWYGMSELAEWIAEKSGLPVYEGGKENAKAIIKEDGSRSIIASIKSHARGRNGLQFNFCHQLIANTMASDRMYQQLLARLHRRGQDQLGVLTEVYMHTPELQASFDQALRRGEYVKETTREGRKLLMGWRG